MRKVFTMLICTLTVAFLLVMMTVSFAATTNIQVTSNYAITEQAAFSQMTQMTQLQTAGLTGMANTAGNTDALTINQAATVATSNDAKATLVSNNTALGTTVPQFANLTATHHTFTACTVNQYTSKLTANGGVHEIVISPTMPAEMVLVDTGAHSLRV